jgi:Na+-driven multidrug efflux pump
VGRLFSSCRRVGAKDRREIIDAMHAVPAFLILAGAGLAIVVAGIVAYLIADDRSRVAAIWGRLVLAVVIAAVVLLLGWYVFPGKRG